MIYRLFNITHRNDSLWRRRAAIVLLLPVLLGALLPRGFMLAQTSGSAETVSFQLVFCSGRHLPAQTITLTADNSGQQPQAGESGCVFALLGADLLPQLGLVLEQPYLPQEHKLDAYAEPENSPSSLRRPPSRAPPVFSFV